MSNNDDFETDLEQFGSTQFPGTSDTDNAWSMEDSDDNSENALAAFTDDEDDDDEGDGAYFGNANQEDVGDDEGFHFHDDADEEEEGSLVSAEDLSASGQDDNFLDDDDEDEDFMRPKDDDEDFLSGDEEEDEDEYGEDEEDDVEESKSSFLKSKLMMGVAAGAFVLLSGSAYLYMQLSQAAPAAAVPTVQAQMPIPQAAPPAPAQIPSAPPAMPTANNNVAGIPQAPQPQAMPVPTGMPDLPGQMTVPELDLSGENPSQTNNISLDISPAKEVVPEVPTETSEAVKKEVADREAVMGRFDDVLSKLEEMNERFVSSDDVEEIVSKNVGAVQKQLESIKVTQAGTNAELTKQIEAMQDRLAAMETEVAALKEAPSPAEVEDNIIAIKADVETSVVQTVKQQLEDMKAQEAAKKKKAEESLRERKLKEQVALQKKQIMEMSSRTQGIVPPKKPKIFDNLKLVGVLGDMVYIQSSDNVYTFKEGDEVSGAGTIVEIRGGVDDFDYSVITTEGIIWY